MVKYRWGNESKKRATLWVFGGACPQEKFEPNTQVSIYSHLSSAIMGEVRGKRYSNMDEYIIK